MGLLDGFKTLMRGGDNSNAEVKHAIEVAMAQAAAIAATPIPFSGSAGLIPTQIKMIQTIYGVHGQTISREVLQSELNGLVQGVVKAGIKQELKRLFVPSISEIGASVMNAKDAALYLQIMGNEIDKGLELGTIKDQNDLQVALLRVATQYLNDVGQAQVDKEQANAMSAATEPTVAANSTNMQPTTAPQPASVPEPSDEPTNNGLLQSAWGSLKQMRDEHHEQEAREKEQKKHKHDDHDDDHHHHHHHHDHD